MFKSQIMLYFSNLDACNQFQWKELKISLYRLLTINPYPIQIIDRGCAFHPANFWL